MEKKRPHFYGAEDFEQLLDRTEWGIEDRLPFPKDWPETLKTAYGICLNCAFPNAIFWGEGLNLIYNEHYASLLGDKHPWAFGKTAVQVYPEIGNTLEPELISVKSLRKTLQFGDTLFLLKRNGYLEECYFNYTLSPIFDSTGKVQGILNIAVEVTETTLSKRRAEFISKFISQRYGQPLLGCIDECGKILHSAAEDLPFHLLYIKSRDKNYKLVTQSGISQGLPESTWPVNELIASGTLKHINNLSDYLPEPIFGIFPEPCQEAVIIPLKHDNSAMSGFLVCGISPRKRLDHDYLIFLQSLGWHIDTCFSNASSYDQYLKLEQEKDNLLGIISHELKTPVTSIKGYTQFATRQMREQRYSEAQEILKKVEKQIAKLGLIINDMIDGSSFIDGKVSFREDEMDFDKMVKNVVNIFRDDSTQIITLDLNLHQTIKGDKQRLEQIVANLISNAIKYSPDKSEIMLSSRIENNELRFSVRDQGIGIKANEQTKIFDRFYRSVKVEKYSYPGIGLGLFIAKEIVTHMDGKIWVDSHSESGSTFHVSIPLIVGTPAPGQ